MFVGCEKTSPNPLLGKEGAVGRFVALFTLLLQFRLWKCSNLIPYINIVDIFINETTHRLKTPFSVEDLVERWGRLYISF